MIDPCLLLNVFIPVRAVCENGWLNPEDFFVVYSISSGASSIVELFLFAMFGS